ncbi:hypothetical protein BpHYR1_052705 [Brachionus plicatilis]|uniref:Uncharacterized protein n=1 Tax=Brachionus plicatilis TaxID=10195 RepID=A0A3M7SK22_BRAPC|nr:hypothetical protein BpHYR1_052705 [Brachionus plicatilis]
MIMIKINLIASKTILTNLKNLREKKSLKLFKFFPILYDLVWEEKSDKNEINSLNDIFENLKKLNFPQSICGDSKSNKLNEQLYQAGGHTGIFGFG